MVNCCVERWASFFVILSFIFMLNYGCIPPMPLQVSLNTASFSSHNLNPPIANNNRTHPPKKWGKWMCSSCLLRSFSLGVSWLVFVAPFRAIMDISAHSMFLVSLHQPPSVNSNSKHLATVRGENKHSSHLFMWVFWSNTCSFFVASLHTISVFGSFCVLFVLIFCLPHVLFSTPSPNLWLIVVLRGELNVRVKSLWYEYELVYVYNIFHLTFAYTHHGDIYKLTTNKESDGTLKTWYELCFCITETLILDNTFWGMKHSTISPANIIRQRGFR